MEMRPIPCQSASAFFSPSCTSSKDGAQAAARLPFCTSFAANLSDRHRPCEDESTSLVQSMTQCQISFQSQCCIHQRPQILAPFDL